VRIDPAFARKRILQAFASLTTPPPALNFQTCPIGACLPQTLRNQLDAACGPLQSRLALVNVECPPTLLHARYLYGIWWIRRDEPSRRKFLRAIEDLPK
jgi:hypothetical protein